MHFVVAANDLQRDLIFPHLFKTARKDGIKVTFEFKPSGVPSVSMLRDARCDLIITPAPPDALDMIQVKLFSGRWKCFYDGDERQAPSSIDEYLDSAHISAQFAFGGFSDDVMRSPDLPRRPVPDVTVSNFAGLAQFIQGTPLITTQIEQMHLGPLKQLTMGPLPFVTEDIGVSMVWHERSSNDPAHRWLRQNIQSVCTELKL